MFNGFYSKELDVNELHDLSNKLDFLGIIRVSGDSLLVYESSSTFYNHKTEITLFKSSKGTNKVNFSYSFSPNFLSWLLAICFFPFGCLIFILPNNEKSNFEFFLSQLEL
jgi:hypothetical protein